jgi:hypothetical protein
VDVTGIPDEEVLRALRAYLAARGLDPELASGPVGARYLTLRAAGQGGTPAEAFGRWFAGVLGGPPGEAEGVGWIAFLLAPTRPDELLGELSAEARRAIAARAPRPERETPLTMPVQELKRARRAATGRALLAPRSPA